MKKINNNNTIPLKHLAFIVFLTLIFGSGSTVSKFILIGLGPLTAAGYRFLIASLTIYFWAKITRKSFYVKPENLFPLLVISVGFAVQIFLSYLGISYTYASRSVLITNLVPFLIMLLSLRFIPEDKVTFRKLVGCCIAFMGIMIMICGKENFEFSLFCGDFCVLISVIIWACVAVYTKCIISNYAPFQLVFYPMIFSSIIFTFVGFLSEEITVLQVSSVVVGAVIYQAVVGTAFGFVAWNTLLKKYGATSLHSFIFLTPISGIISSKLVLKEKLHLEILLALIFIIIGLILVNKSSK